MKKRKLDIAVISDVYLGSHAAHPDELLAYLSSIQPRLLILNGALIDTSATEDLNLPSSHFKVLQKIISMAINGTEVIYITANKDDVLRKLERIQIGTFKIRSEYVLPIAGKKAWFFHGASLEPLGIYSKWISKIGILGFIVLRRFQNVKDKIFKYIGINKIKPAKDNTTIDTISEEKLRNFEKTVLDLAIAKACDYVICGHTHQPKKAVFNHRNGSCVYLNSGDWVQNLTALEYALKRWKVYRYCEDKLSSFFADEDLKAMDLNEISALGNPKKAKEKRSIN
ncbi:UDP-2,3-diacylglucosamine diphosphatase [Arenibacter sp. GZD96]|uniref:UDP-2,3-diacylglucosamine diphosphatase n=1 Tax=Aurantibrevibacter litoralis TaxID=3106030 RepID=UPI002AFF22BD|nr:UDP-2,3-diacylglucosamine diphosphatase [Arenibacter sp. GZD-96]MEA1785396.1 UDP-2,3-diacylglucosamine diphosphatase [Arenibacter sp. GZD-96]